MPTGDWNLIPNYPNDYWEYNSSNLYNSGSHTHTINANQHNSHQHGNSGVDYNDEILGTAIAEDDAGIVRIVQTPFVAQLENGRMVWITPDGKMVPYKNMANEHDDPIEEERYEDYNKRSRFDLLIGG